MRSYSKSAVRICQNQQLEFIWLESKCGSATLAEDSMGYNWFNHKICYTQISKLEVNCWNTWIRHSWIHGFMPHPKSAKKTRRRQPNPRQTKSTLWLFNIAMENGPFIDDFPIKTSIYTGFSIAMLVITRGYNLDHKPFTYWLVPGLPYVVHCKDTDWTT